MTRARLNPLTALFQSSLPLTVGQVIEHIAKTSEDRGEAAEVIARADYSFVPAAAQAELVDYADEDFRAYALTRFLARSQQADPLVAAALWVRHFDQAPSLTAGERVKCLRSVNHLRMALRQILLGLRPNASRAVDAVARADYPIDRRTLAVVAADLLAEIHAWHAEWSVDIHGRPREVLTIEALRLDNDADPFANEHVRMAELAKLADALSPARDEAERIRSVETVRLAWAAVSVSTGTDGYISLDQAARIAGKSTMTIHRWANANPELGRKVGGRWEIDARALRSFIAGREGDSQAA